MSDLRLPSQIIANGGEFGPVTLYLADDNPQKDGTLVYRSTDHAISVTINPSHKAVFYTSSCY